MEPQRNRKGSPRYYGAGEETGLQVTGPTADGAQEGRGLRSAAAVTVIDAPGECRHSSVECGKLIDCSERRWEVGVSGSGKNARQEGGSDGGWRERKRSRSGGRRRFFNR